MTDAVTSDDDSDDVGVDDDDMQCNVAMLVFNELLSTAKAHNRLIIK